MSEKEVNESYGESEIDLTNKIKQNFVDIALCQQRRKKVQENYNIQLGIFQSHQLHLIRVVPDQTEAQLDLMLRVHMCCISLEVQLNLLDKQEKDLIKVGMGLTEKLYRIQRKK
jgi:hypothetical protein